MKPALPLLLLAFALGVAGHTAAQVVAPRTAQRPGRAATPAPTAAAAPTSAASAASAAARPESAPDRAELERTQIIGHRELPKVLYIVPWKKPVLGAMGGRAVTGLVDETLQPVDRDVIHRQALYHAQMQAALTPTPTPTPTPAAAANASSDNPTSTRKP